MEFFDEDRPRFVFQSRPSSHTKEEDDHKIPNKILISIFVFISLLLLSLSFFYFESEPSKSLLLWLSISFLIGPFAPCSLTGGKIRVGYGQILEPEQIHDELSTDNERESRRKSVNKRSSKGMKNDNPPEIPSSVEEVPKKVDRSGIQNGSADKSGNGGGDDETIKETWTNEEDIALLNALKAFPKDAAMRWEKIADAVPGKSKEAYMKRVTELKKGFRSSKSGAN